MRQVVSLELKKAFRTKGFYIALVVGLLISLYHTVWIYRYAYAPNNAEYEEVAEAGEMDKEYGYWYEIGVLDGWLGTELQSPCNQLFYLLLPFLAVLPYGSQLFSEWNNEWVCRSDDHTMWTTQVSDSQRNCSICKWRMCDSNTVAC